MPASKLMLVLALALAGGCAEAPRSEVGASAKAASPQQQKAPPASTQNGRVPQPLLASVIDELAARLNVSATGIRVAEQQAVRWGSSALGCPKPGMSYTEVVMDGYRIVLTHGDEKYTYHTNDRGYFLLCDKPSGAPGGRRPDPT